jgi:arsenate reductase
MGANVTIYHNPRCSKSRQTLALLAERGVEPVIIEYLSTPPDRDTLKKLLGLLGLDARALMRTKEAIYKELNLAAVDSNDKLIDAMVANPILIERPIVVNGDRAAIGRPPENILEIL